MIKQFEFGLPPWLDAYILSKGTLEEYGLCYYLRTVLELLAVRQIEQFVFGTP